MPDADGSAAERPVFEGVLFFFVVAIGGFFDGFGAADEPPEFSWVRGVVVHGVVDWSGQVL